MPIPAPIRVTQETSAALWLIVDMTLNVAVLAIVKWLGGDYAATQVVFLRALIGLALVLPWAWRERQVFRHIDRHRWHLLRIVLASVTLASSFYAVARLPLALFTAINFSRPLVLMAMAALLIDERIGARRWAAAGLGLLGVLVAVNPDNVPLSGAVLALAVTVLAGCGSILVTRKLVDAPAVLLMTCYALGLTVLCAPFALVNWHPVPMAHLPWLVAIGVLTQLAQFCFLRAHALGEVGLLAPLGYLSLFLSALAGWAVFTEVPTAATVTGSVIIVLAALLAGRR